MSKGNWVDKWSVQSETDNTKYYTVSRAVDGSFGCSCPAWIFKKMTCKHIQGVASAIVGLNETEDGVVNRLRFVSKMHHIKLSCDNCKHNSTAGYHWQNCCGLDKRDPLRRNGVTANKQDLMFVKGDKKTFYILGRCCKFYEKA